MRYEGDVTFRVVLRGVLTVGLRDTTSYLHGLLQYLLV